jgi:multidrug efflux pump subunit AcrB
MRRWHERQCSGENTLNWVQTHKRSIIFIALLLLMAGAFSAIKLPVSLFPTVSFPRIVVSVDSGNLPIDQTNLEITRPIAQAIRSIPGVKTLRTTSAKGSSELSVFFEWGLDMDKKLLQIESAVNQTLPRLPQGVSYNAKRMDPTVFPIFGLSLTSDTLSPVELRTFAMEQVRPWLFSIDGVAQVQIQGGEKKQFDIVVDPIKVASFNLSTSNIVDALRANNQIVGVGRFEEGYRLYQVLVKHQSSTIDALSNLPLVADQNGTVLLKDVALVKESVQKEWVSVTANGKNAVLVNILQQPGANSIDLVNALKDTLAMHKDQIPKTLKTSVWYDQSQLVSDAAASVRDVIIVGAILASLVLFLFFRNVKLTIIISLLLPAILIASIFLMKLFGMSFNIMTLGGMAAAAGLVVDDLVVMIEYIIRGLEENKKSSFSQTVYASAKKIGKPLFSTFLATVIVFLPLSFLSGVAGEFFKALAMTITLLILFSVLTAYFVVPVLFERFLHTHNTANVTHASSVMKKVHLRYAHLITQLIRRPLIPLISMLILIALGGVSFLGLGSGFLPRMDEGGFILDYKMEPGTSLTETNRMLHQVETILLKDPAVESYSRRTGLQLGGGISEGNEGDFFIKLKTKRNADVTAVMSRIRNQVEQYVPGLRIETAQLMEDVIGDLTATPQPIEIKVFGSDSALNQESARKIAASITNINGVTEVFDGILSSADAYTIDVDPLRASSEGMSPLAIENQLATLMDGTVATTIPNGSQPIGLRVLGDTAMYNSSEKLSHLPIVAPDGHKFELGRVADIAIDTGQVYIKEENLKPMIAVTARVEGRALGDAMKEVKKSIALLNLSKDISIEYGGIYKEQQQSFTEMLLVVIAAALLIGGLLLAVYENLKTAIIILITIFLSLPGVFLGLWLSGTELNLTALIGLTMILGIVAKTAMYYFSELDSLSIRGVRGFIKAGQLRLRPVVMTAMIAILSLIPLALGIGSGAQMQAPLAIAIISGLLFEIPVVLILMPLIVIRFK